MSTIVIAESLGESDVLEVDVANESFEELEHSLITLLSESDNYSNSDMLPKESALVVDLPLEIELPDVINDSLKENKDGNLCGGAMTKNLPTEIQRKKNLKRPSVQMSVAWDNENFCPKTKRPLCISESANIMAAAEKKEKGLKACDMNLLKTPQTKTLIFPENLDKSLCKLNRDHLKYFNVDKELHNNYKHVLDYIDISPINKVNLEDDVCDKDLCSNENKTFHTPLKKVQKSHLHTPVSIRSPIITCSTPFNNKLIVPTDKFSEISKIETSFCSEEDEVVKTVTDNDEGNQLQELSFDHWLKNDAVNDSVTQFNLSKKENNFETLVESDNEEIDEELEATLLELSENLLHMPVKNTVVITSKNAEILSETEQKDKESVAQNTKELGTTPIEVHLEMNENDLSDIEVLDEINVVEKSDAGSPPKPSNDLKPISSHKYKQIIISQSDEPLLRHQTNSPQLLTNLENVDPVKSEINEFPVPDDKFKNETGGVYNQIIMNEELTTTGKATVDSNLCKVSIPKSLDQPEKSLDVPSQSEKPIASYPEENKDIEHPDWKNVRKLSTDEERYEDVRSRWQLPVIPDPNRDLTFLSFRRKRLLKQSKAKHSPIRLVQGIKRTASKCGSSPPNKRARTKSATCTYLFDSKIDCLKKNFFRASQIATEEYHSRKQHMERRQWNFQHCNQRPAYVNPIQEYYNYPFYDSYMNAMSSTTYHMTMMRNESEKDRLHFEHESRVIEARRKHDSELSALVNAREEVRKFCNFYKGLGGNKNDPTIVTESQMKELEEIEKTYDRFKTFYKDPNN